MGCVIQEFLTGYVTWSNLNQNQLKLENKYPFLAWKSRWKKKKLKLVIVNFATSTHYSARFNRHFRYKNRFQLGTFFGFWEDVINGNQYVFWKSWPGSHRWKDFIFSWFSNFIGQPVCLFFLERNDSKLKILGGNQESFAIFASEATKRMEEIDFFFEGIFDICFCL